MEAMDIISKTHEALMKGEVLSAERKKIICRELLALAKNKMEKTHLYHEDMTKESATTFRMYARFYLPNLPKGVKYHTITGVIPDTNIFASNSYELEILRLLAFVNRKNAEVVKMLEATKQRLSTTCFGNFCDKGECFETSIVVLRFLATAFPEEKIWIQQLLDGIQSHFKDKRRRAGTYLYYWLILSELPLELALPVINQNKEHLLLQLGKNCRMKDEEDCDKNSDKNRLSIYIIRNCLSRLTEYSVLQEMDPVLMEDFLNSKEKQPDFATNSK
ncbi:MAG: hypothetical protein WBI07_09570 [Mobilitalea sp.]